MPYRLNIKLGIGKILDEQTTNSGTKRKTVPVNLNDFFFNVLNPVREKMDFST